MVNSFKILSEGRKTDSKYITNFFITEKSLVENFENLFQYKCNMMAKIIYIKLSK
jgi:hypothetical protein